MQRMNQMITMQCVCGDLGTYGLKEAYCFSLTDGISFTDHCGDNDRCHRPIQVPQLMEHFLLGWRRGTCFKDSRILCGVIALQQEEPGGRKACPSFSTFEPPKLLIYTMGWNFKKLFHQWRFLGHPLRKSSENSACCPWHQHPVHFWNCSEYNANLLLDCYPLPPILLSASCHQGAAA